jgi:adenine phosphoribosyltransferase
MNHGQLRRYVRDIPDFPQAGVLFRDLTPMLRDPDGFRLAVAGLADRAREARPDLILGIDSRGFLFGAPVALELQCGFVPARKPGKLPWAKFSETYTLEYGSGALEIHQDAIEPGQRVVVIDDLLATGGTAAAAARLIERSGGLLVGLLFVVELLALSGRERLGDRPVEALIQY